MVTFCFLHSFCIYACELFCNWEFPLPPLCLFINHIYFILDSWILIYSFSNSWMLLFILLLLSFFPLWPLGTLSGCPLYPSYLHLAFFFSFLNTSLLSGAMRCFMFILYFPILIPGVYHFSKEPLFLLLENGVYKPKSGCWGMLIAATRLTASRSSQ